MSRILPFTIAAAALTSLACGGSEPVGVNPRHALGPGVHIVAGADVTDTVDATPQQALVVRVVDADSNPVPNAIVRFTSVLRTNNQSGFSQATMALTKLTSAIWTTLAIDTTDQQGEAGVLVRLGTPAGSGGIIVTVPTLGFATTAGFTILPGAAARVVVAPADTTVYVGGAITLRAATVDRYQNPRTDPVTLSVSRPIASVQGTTLTASDIGRTRITVTAGARSDTAGLSVVPRGTIVAQAVMESTGIDLALYTFDLDGSHLHKLVSSVVSGTGYFGELPPVWSADGQSVFYHDNKFDHTRFLRVVDVASGVARALMSPDVALRHEGWPAVSGDGRWVYFDGSDFGGTTLYRTNPAGTVREQVGPAGIAGPTVSPDGQRVAAVGNTFFYASVSGPIVVFDIAAKHLTTLSATAQAVAWSPVEDRIAYIAGTSNELRIVNPDGSGDRSLALDAGFSGRIAWSPDGKYVIGHHGKWLGIVNVATGEVIPVTLGGLSVGLTNPSWKP